MRVQLWRYARAAPKAKGYTDADFPPWFGKNEDGDGGFDDGVGGFDDGGAGFDDGGAEDAVYTPAPLSIGKRFLAFNIHRHRHRHRIHRMVHRSHRRHRKRLPSSPFLPVITGRSAVLNGSYVSQGFPAWGSYHRRGVRWYMHAT